MLVATTFAQPATHYLVSTIAGSMPLGDGGPATSAFLDRPQAVAVDSQGTVYIADAGNYAIRKVTSAGVISTLPGINSAAYDLKTDASNNLYVATYSQVLKVSVSGAVSVLAGASTSGYGGDGAKATAANFAGIRGIAFDSSGNLYIADSENHRIRKVDSDGVVRTVAGTGTRGSNGDNQAALNTQLWLPSSVAVDAAGNIYISDRGNCKVRKVEAGTGVVKPFAGDGYYWSDGDGGLATNASIYPGPILFDNTGNLLIVDNYVDTVRSVSASGGVIRTVIGSGRYGFRGDGGDALAARLAIPAGLAVDRSGAIYVTDSENARIRKVTPTGSITTVAGTQHFKGDGAQAADALLHQPQKATVAPDGTIFFSDYLNHRVRKIAPNGVISTVAGDGEPDYLGDGADATKASLARPTNIARDASGNLYVIDQYGYGIRRITPQGLITTFAGNGYVGFGNDGSPANRSPFRGIYGMAVDSAGNVIFSDSGNHRVRKITPDGFLSTLAGNGTAGFSGDGGLATSAQVDSPDAIAIDKDDNIYFFDLGNVRIRKISKSGTISTVAGNGKCCYATDGQDATQSPMYVSDMAMDAAGYLWVINATVLRVIEPSGKVRLIAGDPANPFGFAGDGLTAGLLTRFDTPYGVALSAGGDVIVVDTYNNRIRKLTPNPAARLEIVSGNNQSLTAGEAAKAAIVVRLFGKAGGGLAGATVSFAVTAGEAKLAAATSNTDSNGTAGISFTPTKAGALTIVASAGGFSAAFNFTVQEAPPVVTPPPVQPPAADTPKIAAGGIVQNGFSMPSVTEVSPGAITSIFGSNFAAEGSSPVSGAIENGRMQTKVAGLCVTFGSLQAPLLAVSPSQLTVQVPAVAPGAVAVRVIRNCGASDEARSEAVNVTARAATPELIYLRSNTDGRNPVAAVSATGEWVGAANAVPGVKLTPAKPGDIIVLYALGLGATTPEVEPGLPAPGVAQVAGDFHLSVGGVEVGASDLFYAGASPSFLGLYQINLRVPAGVASGDQPVSIRVGSQASPAGAYLTVAQ
jgi:uncharacterized protein (TIGR03437 family)